MVSNGFREAQFPLYTPETRCYSSALRPGPQQKVGNTPTFFIWRLHDERSAGAPRRGTLGTRFAMERAKTIEAIEELLRPPVEGLGYELVAVQLGSEQGRLVLRLLVDRPGGITLGECVGISREVGPHLDVADLIPSRYALEVSSPGIQRPLRRVQDYERFRGERVVVRTREAVDGRKTFRGINRGPGEDGLLMVDDRDTGRRHAIPLVQVREAHLDPDLPF